MNPHKAMKKKKKKNSTRITVVVIQDKKDPEVCWLLQWCSTPLYFILSFDFFSHDCLPHFTVEISYLTKIK